MGTKPFRIFILFLTASTAGLACTGRGNAALGHHDEPIILIENRGPRPVTLEAAPTETATAEGPHIDMVNHDALRPLRVGDQVTITLRGTAGDQASFDIGAREMNLPLAEDPLAHGVYRASYIVRPGDDLLQGHVIGHLKSASGLEDILQSRRTVTIDTVAPRILSVEPGDHAATQTMQPTITIAADDIGGSGLASATLELSNEGHTFEVPATLEPQGARALAPHPLSGIVNGTARILDRAGNGSQLKFTFVVNEATGTENIGSAITSLVRNGDRALQSGEAVIVDMFAPDAGRASFDVTGDNDRVVARDVAMFAIAAGRYRGTYLVEGGPTTQNLHIIGRYSDIDNRVSTFALEEPLVVLPQARLALSIEEPKDGEKKDVPFTVRGHCAPNSEVTVAVRAEGVKPKWGIFAAEYRVDCGSFQSRADGAGAWTLVIPALPQPDKVTDLQYVLKATARDEGGRQTEPVAVTVMVH